MNVPTITMDPAAAREKLRALRTQLHRRADAEFQALAAGYEALVEGKKVIHLSQAIQAGGFDHAFRPRLAIGRADRLQVRFDWRLTQTRGTFDTTNARRMTRQINGVVSVDLGREPERVQHFYSSGGAYMDRPFGFALMPIVPAEVVSTIRGATNLRHFFTLFEVEEWAEQRISAKPDIDPYLLRHIGGELYAVVAEWELTELERAVMAVRADA